MKNISRQIQLNESKIDTGMLYFHGSSEAKVSQLDAPSYEHPFYVTTDLHYAMAFCTKNSSNTGDYDVKKTFTPSSQNYVYVVTLKPDCKVFDFRNHSSPEFKEFYKIIDKSIVDWVESSSIKYAHDDIYEFIDIFQEEILKPFEHLNWRDYDEYADVFSKEPRVMSPDLFSKVSDMVQKLDLKDAYKSYEIHEIMAPILKELNKLGFQGILTTETDYNNDTNDLHIIPAKVTTNYAIGIFDKSGLDMIGLVPMKYVWLKKINPDYQYNKTASTAEQKIRRFIQLYKSIAKDKTANKQTLNEKTKFRKLKKKFKHKGQAAFPEIKSDDDIVFVSGIPKDKALQLLKRACHNVSNFHPEYMEKAVKWSDDQIFGVFNKHDKRNVLAMASVSYNGDKSGAAYLHEMTGFIKGGYGKKLVIWLLQKFKKVYGQIALEGSGTKDDPYKPNEKLRDKFYTTIPSLKIYRVEDSIWDCPADFFYYGISDESIKEFLEKTYSKDISAIVESKSFNQTMYRFIIGNVGVYEAAKDLIFSRFGENEAKKKWSEVLIASSWLPKPDFQYSEKYQSWFTFAGKNLFEKTVLRVLRSLSIDNIKLCESIVDDSRIVYSDIYQVIVKSDKINENDKNDVNDIKSIFDEVVSQYKILFDIDLSYMTFKVDSQPVYTNGDPCYEYDEDECAGDWTSLGWIRLNPNMKSVMDRYGVAWHGSDDIEEFTKFIIAHELAHEVWNNIADDQFKNGMIEKANDENFNTVYLETVNTNKLAEETFCEYLAHEIVQQRKKIDFPEEEMQDLSRRKHIVTHRVSDDALLFNVGDIVDAPWQIPYKITKKNVVNDIYDSPYVDQLSQEQLKYLEQFDNIAILDLIAQYESPYSLEQIKAKYPEHIYGKLASDPVHRWRAETGIELIHKEPTEEELDRIWKNWQLMPSEMKDISDKKSLEMFGCTNAEHYAQLKSN